MINNGIWVGLCGEFATDPLGIILLIGLGIDELSMVSSIIPLAKKIIRSIDFGIAQEISRQALTLTTAKDVANLINSNLETKYPILVKFLHDIQLESRSLSKRLSHKGFSKISSGSEN